MKKKAHLLKNIIAEFKRKALFSSSLSSKEKKNIKSFWNFVPTHLPVGQNLTKRFYNFWVGNSCLSSSKKIAILYSFSLSQFNFHRDKFLELDYTLCRKTSTFKCAISWSTEKGTQSCYSGWDITIWATDCSRLVNKGLLP